MFSKALINRINNDKTIKEAFKVGDEHGTPQDVSDTDENSDQFWQPVERLDQAHCHTGSTTRTAGPIR